MLIGGFFEVSAKTIAEFHAEKNAIKIMIIFLFLIDRLTILFIYNLS
jgi:hypothetical protein